MNDTVYTRRRAELMKRIGPGAVAVVHGGRLARRNSDVEHKYRQPSDMLYLTGFEEPESLAVLAPGRAEPFVMFVRPRDPDREVWTGRRLGVDGAKAQLGADAAYSIDEAAAKLADVVDGARELHYLVSDDAAVDKLVLETMQALKQGERRGRVAPTRIVDLRASLHEMRLYKDAEALDTLRRAVDITAEAHVAAMRATRPGAHEYEIEALVDYTFRRRGGAGPGYGTIVGGGRNATILHYIENADPLREGDLLLVDAGCEYRGFTADVTRTWPVGARFTDAQRRLYDAVLAAQKQVIALVRPGATVEQLHERTVELLTQGMVQLGLLRGDVEELIKQGEYRKYYMHRTSHWLGLDVHDAGIYFPEPGRARPLEPGMVLTIEPGLYVAEDDATAPEGLRGVGVRIEDDVLVTDGGHEVLTRAIPKDADELEAIKREALGA